jgi:hypothetical protein
MRPTRSLSLGSPFHLGRMMAFSGWCLAWLSTVSRRMTLERSRLRYDRSCEWLAMLRAKEGTLPYLDVLALLVQRGFPEQRPLNDVEGV